jgi:hypothetical protein
MDSLSSSSTRVFSLQDLADHVAERTLWFWYRADDYLSEWPNSAAEDLKAMQADLAADPGRVSILSVLDHTAGNNSTLDAFAALRSATIDLRLAVLDRRHDMERRRSALFRRISGRIRDFVTANDCAVQGVGPTGAAVEVPRAILPQLEIDLRSNVLATIGGGIRWEAVVVLWRTQTPRPQRPDRKGDQRAILAALKELYGSDIPTGMGSTGPEAESKMQRRLEKEKKMTRTTDAIRRALGRKE